MLPEVDRRSCGDGGCIGSASGKELTEGQCLRWLKEDDGRGLAVSQCQMGGLVHGFAVQRGDRRRMQRRGWRR